MTLSIYDPYYPGPIAPVTKAGWNIGLWANNTYRFFRVLLVEPLPPGPQLIQDIGVVNASSNSIQTEITVVEALEGTLVQARFRPLDDIEVEVSQLRGTGRYVTNTQQSRVTPFSAALDPYYALTTFFVLGAAQNPYVVVYNQTGYNLTTTRIQFWGFKYFLQRLPDDQELLLRTIIVDPADQRAVNQARQMGLTATVVPAMGRAG